MWYPALTGAIHADWCDWGKWGKQKAEIRKQKPDSHVEATGDAEKRPKADSHSWERTSTANGAGTLQERTEEETEVARIKTAEYAEQGTGKEP